MIDIVTDVQHAVVAATPGTIAHQTLSLTLAYCSGAITEEELRDAAAAALREAARLANKSRGAFEAVADATIRTGRSSKKARRAKRVGRAGVAIVTDLDLTRAALHFAYAALWQSQDSAHRARLALSDSGLLFR